MFAGMGASVLLVPLAGWLVPASVGVVGGAFLVWSWAKLYQAHKTGCAIAKMAGLR